MDENNNRNLILATVLSFLVIMVWFVLFPPPEPVVTPPAAELTIPDAPTLAAAADTATAVPEAPRLTVDTPQLQGSISLLGGRIDDLSLKGYRETIDKNSDIVRLLSPVGEAQPFYALFGWVPGGSLAFDDVPGPKTEWQLTAGATLAPGKPVTLSWDNGKGLVFTRDVSVDESFMFTVTDTVANTGTGDMTLAPYAQIARHGLPELENIYVVHEGVIARADGALTETDYSEVVDLPVLDGEGQPGQKVEATTDGWIGFTDHYWMAVLVPEQGKAFTSVTKYVASADIYQTDVRRPAVTVAPGTTASSTTRLFAGAKDWGAIRDYQNTGGASALPIPGFLDVIDWGWFFFLTKPIFAVLHWLNAAIGNMGLAIIALTFVLKIIVLPLAYKSYVSMARMKELQPEMEALKERAGEDKQRMQREMMQLYRDKKVNPAAGCLPILIQIPIFFALFKVISVTSELRHAPFFGWLNDLSAPDSSSLFNLFGLLPWAAPETGSLLHLIFLGALPLILGVTMWLQQKLNPQPTDQVQATIFAWMPWVFMFMMAGFASGLLVYWITNNVITFAQQYIIMRSHGHKPDIFGNIKSGLKRKPVVAAPAANTPAKPTPKPPTKPAGGSKAKKS